MLYVWYHPVVYDKLKDLGKLPGNAKRVEQLPAMEDITQVFKCYNPRCGIVFNVTGDRTESCPCPRCGTSVGTHKLREQASNFTAKT
jgi:uncharacterized C2H2 Zn-finger protein